MQRTGSGGARARAAEFCSQYGLAAPVLLAPMAGACRPALSIAVARGGGMAACGALLMSPDEIREWVDEVRAATDASMQLNVWIPEPPPARDATAESAMRSFLIRDGWSSSVADDAGDLRLPDFAAQCDAMIACRPRAMSSIMGLYPPDVVERMKAAGIAWFATATTVAEAVAAEAAGADVIVAQGMEAGGHRGAFDAARADRDLIGLVSLVPAVADAVRLPVVAAGGIADARGVAAALVLGASAVMVGTAFLRCPESSVPQAWKDALARTHPEGTAVTRALTGRPGRAVATAYVRAAAAPGAPAPTPYPVQRGLTRAMTAAAARVGDIDRMQAWAGQSASLAREVPASQLVRELWEGARAALG